MDIKCKSVNLLDIILIALDNNSDRCARLAERIIQDLQNAGYNFNDYNFGTMYIAIKSAGYDTYIADTINAIRLISEAAKEALPELN